MIGTTHHPVEVELFYPGVMKINGKGCNDSEIRAITYHDKQKSSTFASILAPGEMVLIEDALMTVDSAKFFCIYDIMNNFLVS